MPKYTALFHTRDEHAYHDIEAHSRDHALELALELWRRDPRALEFKRYHASRQLDLIGLSGPEEWTQYVTVWQSDDFRLRQAADTLLEALKNAVEVLASVNADRK